MLKTVFENVLLLSLLGSAATLVLLLLRPLTQKYFSPSWQYHIWLLALNALILPLPKPSAAVVYLPRANPMLHSGIKEPLRRFSEAVSAPTADWDLAADWMLLAAFIWLVGVCFTLCLKITRYCVFRSELLYNSSPDERDYGLPRALSVRRTWLLDAPLLIGLLKPTLYLPQTVDEKALSYILAHEVTHYKRRDLLFKWYAQLIFSMHWFNPLMLVLSRQIDAECEASCDYLVTRSWSAAESDGYMNMILEQCTNTGLYRPLTTRMASGKKVLKRRFFAIRNSRKSGRKLRAVSVTVALSLFLLTQLFGVVLANRVWSETVVIYTDVPELPIKGREEAPEEVLPVEPTPTVPTPPEEEAEEVAPTPPLPEQPAYPGEVVDLVYSTEMTAEQIFGMAQKPLSNTDILSLAEVSKEITYNSDIKGKQTLTVYPDANGKITVFFDSPEPRIIAEVEIRNADHPGGWGYSLPTDSKTAYEFGGFDPTAAYIVTINTYCPGNYGIEGRALIY